jgi:hypothetical protein
MLGNFGSVEADTQHPKVIADINAGATMTFVSQPSQSNGGS